MAGPRRASWFLDDDATPSEREIGSVDADDLDAADSHLVDEDITNAVVVASDKTEYVKASALGGALCRRVASAWLLRRSPPNHGANSG